MILAALLVGLSACNDPYEVAMEDGSFAVLEAFAQEHPNHRMMHVVKFKLEQLTLGQAEEAGTVEAWDAYLQSYPEGELREKGETGRLEAVWNAAATGNDPAAWTRFLEDYPKADRDRRWDAERRRKVAHHKDKIVLGAVNVEPVNLAENPDGPYDGYAISADVTWSGEVPLPYLQMAVEFLAGDGSVLRTERWPLVAPQGPKNLPMEEEWKVPVEPEETRRYYYTTEGPKTGKWERKARVVPVAIKLEGETSTPK